VLVKRLCAATCLESIIRAQNTPCTPVRVEKLELQAVKKISTAKYQTLIRHMYGFVTILKSISNNLATGKFILLIAIFKQPIGNDLT